MRQKILLLFLIVILLGITHCDSGGGQSVLNVPFCAQEQDDWCSYACIQMWAQKDGNYVTQQQISESVGIPYPSFLAIAVSDFTNSDGFCNFCPDGVPGAQGDLIASMAAAIDNNSPSIMPIFNGTHAVLVIGYEGNEIINNRPLAEALYWHDPWDGPEIYLPISDVKNVYFTPAQGEYYAILGRQNFSGLGLQYHDAFVMQGGTYYGGPNIYNPKTLIVDPGIYLE